MRCKADHCPDDVGDEKAFCSLHWDLLPRVDRFLLTDAYGTLNWTKELLKAVAKLRKIEGFQSARSRNRS